MKKLFSFLSAILMLVATVWAEGPWTSGDCTVTFDDETRILTVSGNGAMANGTPWYGILGSVTSVVIEDGVTSIGEYAFDSCSLTSVTIPDSVKSIGRCAFKECVYLAGVTIPESVTSIGRHAFYHCDGLKNVIIPDSVKRIVEYAFYYCMGLTHVTIGSGVIASSAFAHCSGLKSVTIGSGVTEISSEAFDYCYATENVYCYADPAKLYWGSYGNHFNGAATKIYVMSDQLSTYQSNFGSYTSATFVGGLENIVLVTENEDGSYEFTMPTFNVKVTQAMENENQWTSGDCTVTFDEETGTLTVCGTGAMADYDDMEMPPWYGKAGNDIKKVVIEDGVTHIGDSAFWYCMNVESVSIPSSVTSIGEAAFGNWYALADVQLHDGLTTIGVGAFYGNHLTSFTIPATVTTIGDRAFFKTDFTDVYCHPNAADLTWGDATGDFKSDGSTKIHVKASQLTAYQAKFPHVNATFVGDLDMTPEIAATIDAIDAIGEVTYTGECKAKIDAAREAYDALTDGQKALVTNYATLTDAEAAYAAFGQGGETPFTVTRPWTANAKAVLNGAMYDAAGNVAGVAQLKVTKPKVDKKTGAKTVKVSGYLLPNGGKKATLKATVFTILTDAPTEAAIPAKSLGSFRVKIGDDGFLGTAGAYTAHTASVGGKWTRGDAKVTVATSATLPEGTVKSLLPDGVPVRVKGGKWAFDKAASITYKKGVLGGDSDPKKPNRSAMKLTYTPKTGLFKGSFKVYAVQGGKLKKYTVKVTGVVVDGEGTGVGKLAKPAVTWSVRVSG